MSKQHALLLDDPWRIDARDFPEAGDDATKLLFLANYAVLAPSILNVQPWRFRIAGGTMELFADRSRILPVVDPDGRELTVSCGAALLNLRIAARAFGRDIEVESFPDPAQPDLLARMQLRHAGSASELDTRLHRAIGTRRTHRSPFDAGRPERDLLAALAGAARREGAMLAFADDAETKRRAAQLVADAERIHLADDDFRRELSDWLRRRYAEGQEPPRETNWGLAGPAGHTPPPRDRPDLFTQTAANIAREFASPETAAAQQLASVEASPMLGLLATRGDEPADWLAAGQALQRALLTGAAAGLGASYLNSPIEIAPLRRRLPEIFGLHGKPQVLLRFGYARPSPPSPRRPVGEVVEWAGPG